MIKDRWIDYKVYEWMKINIFINTLKFYTFIHFFKSFIDFKDQIDSIDSIDLIDLLEWYSWEQTLFEWSIKFLPTNGRQDRYGWLSSNSQCSPYEKDVHRASRCTSAFPPTIGNTTDSSIIEIVHLRLATLKLHGTEGINDMLGKTTLFLNALNPVIHLLFLLFRP